MKKIALLHTVVNVLENFPGQLKKELGELEILNTYDDFLATDPARKGEFTKTNLERMFHIVKALELAQPDAIVVTCSTLSPAVFKIKELINTPLIAIDEMMISEAVAKAEKRVAVLATAVSTVNPTTASILNCARKFNNGEGKALEVSVVLAGQAFDAVKAGNIKLHDEILLQEAQKIKNTDLIILAQASMAHLEDKIKQISGIETLSSPKRCFKQIRSVLNL